MPISDHYRQHKLYNKELYADFIAAQIKTLSFLAYIIRLYQVFWLWVLIDLRLKSIDIDFSLCDYWIVVCVRTLGQDLVGKYSQQMVKGMLQLLSNCPPETAHLRKELLIAAKHILTTDLRSRKSPSLYTPCCTVTHFQHCLYWWYTNKACRISKTVVRYDMTWGKYFRTMWVFRNIILWC